MGRGRGRDEKEDFSSLVCRYCGCGLDFYSRYTNLSVDNLRKAIKNFITAYGAVASDDSVHKIVAAVEARFSKATTTTATVVVTVAVTVAVTITPFKPLRRTRQSLLTL